MSQATHPARDRALDRQRAIAALCLLAQVLGVAHLLLVRHETCYEHQTLVHASSASQDADAFARGQSAGGEETSLRVSELDTAGHADDHCLLAAFRKRDQILSSAPVPSLWAPTTATGVELAVVAAEGAPAVPILRLAPKGSPPARV